MTRRDFNARGAAGVVFGALGKPTLLPGEEKPAANPVRSAVKRFIPRGRNRIFYVSDPSSIATNLLPDPVKERDLRRWVDTLADCGVDMFDQEVYSQGWTAYWRSPKFEYDRRLQHRRFLPMLDAGIQPLNVLIDQSHKRGMPFIAGFRVNDNHGFQSKQQGVGIAAFIDSHPEWKLTDFPPGPYYKLSEPLDFTFDAVRNYVFGVMEEVVKGFDVDGLEMCFRDHAYFPVNKGAERAGLLTDLVGKTRALLDRQGKAKGRKLLLGARVFSTLKECSDLGLDVRTWVEKGLIDFLSPEDVMYADFNAPYQQFAALTRNSKCMLYPTILPWPSSRARGRLSNIPMTSSNQRALAHTFYGAGADGMSVYNDFLGIWFPPFYPQRMRIFHELRDPARVARGERHYIFDPTWSGQTGFGADGLTSTGAMKANKLVLGHVAGAKGEYPFNMYEDFSQIHGANLLFRGFGLAEADELEVRLNGHLIEDSAIGRTLETSPHPDWAHVRHAGGRAWKSIPEQGRVDFRKEAEPSFSTRWFDLNGQFMRWGENVLSVVLVKGAPQATGQIVIDELEAWVQPK